MALWYKLSIIRFPEVLMRRLESRPKAPQMGLFHSPPQSPSWPQLPREIRQQTELSPQTFCTFPREFSSDSRHELQRAATLFLSRVLPIYSCLLFPVLRAAPSD